LCALAEWYVFSSNGKEDLVDVNEKLENAKEVLLHAYDILKDLEDASDKLNEEKKKNVGDLNVTSQEKFINLFHFHHIFFFYLFFFFDEDILKIS
jgi:hypothetical protein